MAICIGLAQANTASAAGRFTPAEEALLPAYCEFTQTWAKTNERQRKYAEYLRRFGNGWKHMHHYCWGLVSLSRATRHNAQVNKREYHTRKAIDDFDYVLQNAPQDFVMLFQIAYRKARALIVNQQLLEAEKVSKELLQRWPDRADSYGIAAEILLARKRPGLAGEILEKAKSIVKDTNRLKRIRAALKI